MKQYLNLLYSVLYDGNDTTDRTGVGTCYKFAPETLRFNLRKGFPVLTTKRIAFQNVVHELFWFISGSTNYKDLPESVHKWWAPWANPDGDLGPIYGRQLRDSRSYIEHYSTDGTHRTIEPISVDQLSEIINSLKTNPTSRRHVINLWHTADMALTKLSCCHGTEIQFDLYDGELSCSMYQRSADLFIGLPINIASYALFTHLIANAIGAEVGDLIINLGNAHIYSNHFEQVKEQIGRYTTKLPTLQLNGTPNPDSVLGFDYDLKEIKLIDYNPQPAIKGDLNV